MVVSNAASNQSISTDFQPQNRFDLAVPSRSTTVDIKPSGFGGLNLLSIGKISATRRNRVVGKSFVVSLRMPLRNIVALTLSC